MHTITVLQHLKKHGQLLDSEIAAATGIPLEDVRISLMALSAQGEISKCSVTTFKDGKPIEGIQCRIAGYAPPAAPGRKPAVKVPPNGG
ncbi:MAG: transcriptional regulator [Betaproteobacteria bacterium HGW-Betaproteobacteria-10]|nr:MAG: transcriptional regulator [Betaproteobacteria bacterium HGW-Betaproteobacteria-10]